MLRGIIEPWHLIILVVLIAVIFGWKKLPDAARSLGRSMRIFKAEVEEMKHDQPSAASRETVDGETVTQTTTTQRTQAPQQPAPATQPQPTPQPAQPQATTSETASTEWVEAASTDHQGGSSQAPRV